MSGAWSAATGPMYGVDLTRFRDADGDGIGDLRGVIAGLEHIAALGAEWIWLLPFYPSERRDNGYDVDDHTTVDPRLGDLDDFAELVERSHRLGLKLMIDLVIHHTSDRHPWFRAARADRSSRYGAYYVWADEPVRTAGDGPVFPGEDDDVWCFDEVAGAYFHHQFYRFQPDLNLANPIVFDEVAGIAELWLSRGVDGLRIDAAIPAVRPKGTDGTQVDEGTLYDRLRARVAAVAPDAVLAAEADVPPEALAPLVTNRRMDAVFDFTLNNRVFLALARRDAGPIEKTLVQLDGTLPASGRLNFIRNLDELDLDQLAEPERQEVFAEFAPEERMLLYGRGLRRSWAPMMGDRRRFRMTLSLLMALPGIPLLMHGQELGLGEDLEVAGRGACRPVMQWTAEPGVGFSPRADSPMILPAQRFGPFDAAHVNVADQDGDPGSNLELTRALVRARSRTRGGEGARALPSGRPAVLALADERILTLHNLGPEPRAVPLPEAAAEVILAEGWDGGELGPYGFAWLAR